MKQTAEVICIFLGIALLLVAAFSWHWQAGVALLGIILVCMGGDAR